MTWFNNVIKVCYAVITFHKSSNDVQCRDMDSKESTRAEVGCGVNEDVKMDEWSHQPSWTELGMK